MDVQVTDLLSWDNANNVGKAIFLQVLGCWTKAANERVEEIGLARDIRVSLFPALCSAYSKRVSQGQTSKEVES